MNFEIRKSRKKGKGLFATKRYRKGSYVGKMEGKIVHGSAWDPRYAVELGEDSVLEPAEPFRYLNHSCHPNCELCVFEGDEHEIWIYVLRTIRSYEELTIDYSWPDEDAIPCLCGEKNCRGRIVSNELQQ